MKKSTLSILTQILGVVCFITVTSKGLEGKVVLSVNTITHIESSSNSCQYSPAIYLRNGTKICTAESFDRLQSLIAITNARQCDSN
jgi:hypothetical protein